MYKNIEIVAEVKTCSPFGWSSKKSWNELFSVANDIGDIISIHTDSGWDGSFNLIAKAKKLTNKPILAKGIHKNDGLIKQAINAGADLVLVVGRIPKTNHDKCIIEPNTLAELKAVPPSFKVIWNSRNLINGLKKKETFEEARKLWAGWLCQASFIKTIYDIKSGADAVLVGANIISFSKSIKKLGLKQPNISSR